MTPAPAVVQSSLSLLVRLLAIGALFCAASYPSRAAAAPTESSARAEQLFKHARELMAANRFDEACPELEESQRLDPAPGTLLNLADCYEKSGKLASAWWTYQSLLPEARRLGQRDRETYASDRIVALERRVSRLTLEFAPGASADEYKVELDGKAVAAETVRSSFPVDGGGHRVRVSSPRHEPWIGHVALAREKDSKTLKVPLLQPLPAPAGTASSSVAFDAGTATPPPGEEARPVGTAVYAFGVGALVCAGGAGITGGLALAKANDYEDANRDPARTPDERRDLRDEARSLALVSTVLTGAAVAAGGVTLYLFLTRPERSVEASAGGARLRLTPWVASNAAGLGVAGAL